MHVTAASVELMPQNQLLSPMYIQHNAGQFLNHDWVNIDLFREYLQRTGQNFPAPDASNTLSSSSVRTKIEAPAASVPDVVKAGTEMASVPVAGNVKIRTLNEGGREVLELLSESLTFAVTSAPSARFASKRFSHSG
ncbi:hypothetical protein DFH08DRAFT_961674 [Mycena albidolilacea]|uniref:Uncharacterized protein n=1 Tax=Mycena albidolilacea TaxID=1033008 RepID=A0AAD6ZZ67_9AGAR|nr:hypothetical protein DFH08DRAFT_961674 [Mycena albidolilacea]